MNAYPTDRTEVDSWTKVGTLAEFVNSIEETTVGSIPANDTKDAYEALGIAFKMQESAGNDYQSMDLGGAFDICITATQLDAEEDSFDDQYDVDAEFAEGVNRPALRSRGSERSRFRTGRALCTFCSCCFVSSLINMCFSVCKHSQGMDTVRFSEML